MKIQTSQSNFFFFFFLSPKLKISLKNRSSLKTSTFTALPSKLQHEEEKEDETGNGFFKNLFRTFSKRKKRKEVISYHFLSPFPPHFSFPHFIPSQPVQKLEEIELLCRICEEVVKSSQLEEHSKFCNIAHTFFPLFNYLFPFFFSLYLNLNYLVLNLNKLTVIFDLENLQKQLVKEDRIKKNKGFEFIYCFIYFKFLIYNNRRMVMKPLMMIE